MNKLSLDLDGLQVESFATDATASNAGTVNGHDALSKFTQHPCQSIDIGCISDPTACHCQPTGAICP